HNYLQTNTPVGMFDFNSNFTQLNPTTANLPNGTPTGSGFASFLLGYGVDANQGYVNPVASQQIYPALYAQDQFKATSKLTLNLGVRWEQNGPYSECLMGLRPTKGNENLGRAAAVRCIQCGTVKAVCALDELRPFPSLARNVRFEPMSVSLPIPSQREG